MAGCGDRLPAGTHTDAGAARVSAALTSVRELAPHEYGLPKAAARLTHLDDVRELLDPRQNPAAFRLCQGAALASEAIPALLGLAQFGCRDALRCRSLEVLAQLSFAHAGGAEAIAADEGVLKALHAALGSSSPVQLAGLQLAQALAAAPAGGAVTTLAPALAQAARQFLLGGAAFEVLARAALDVMVSASFHDAGAVAAALPVGMLRALVAEDGGRPAWLPADPLHVLACGLLAANAVAAPALDDDGDDALTRQCVAERLTSGQFVELYHVALDAAAGQAEWPQGSGVYHSQERLALAAQRLADLGQHRRLVGAVPHLARIVEMATDDRAGDAALTALLILGRDVACLVALLGLSSFRQDVLGPMCDAGDSAPAVSLASYLADVEGMLQAAQDTLDATRSFVPHAPSVRSLAEVFARLGPLDAEVGADRLLGALGAVPVGPRSAVLASLSGSAAMTGFTFQDFARYVYGTPTVLGWWPGFMEDAASKWSAVQADWAATDHALPSLADVLALFERGAGDKSTVSALRLLEDIVPSLGFGMDNAAVEDAFYRIRGQERLSLSEFADWLGGLYSGAAREAAEARAHEAEEAARVAEAQAA